MLISIGEEPLINSNFIFSIVLGLVMCLSAMIAPFCEEKMKMRASRLCDVNYLSNCFP